WRASSFHLRDMGLGGWMADLLDIVDSRNGKDALRLYRAKLYMRGAVASKEGQEVISDEILASEEAAGFETSGIFAKRAKRFTRGLVLGSRAVIQEWVEKLRESGRYARRKNPLEMEAGLGFSLR
ncbi:MAG: hypothetical protein HQL31_08380, partial [Planctomycetes bacterium]|nr:hypothetical protein [Planctomycetota bacterium]